MVSIGVGFLAATMSLAGCTGAKPGPIPTAAPSTAETYTCQSLPTRERCEEVVVAGRQTRYTFLPAQQATNKSIVLDLGGPGISVLSGNFSLAALKAGSGRLGSAYNWVVLEEPWVTAPVTTSCEQSMSRYYTALAGAADVPAAIAAVRNSCQLGTGRGRWGFDARHYAEAVRVIARKHAVEVTGFVGHSFGAVRLSYLNELPLQWVILSRPFPVGATPDEIVAGRLAAIGRMAGGAGQPATASLKEAFDLASATVRLGYVPAPALEAQRKAVLDARTPTVIRKLSDNLWFRYGSDSIAPALLAQAEEICAVSGPLVDKRYSVGVEGVLRAGFLPCTEPARVVPASPRIGKICIITAANDTVAPGRLARERLARLYPAASWQTSDVASHRSVDGLADCHSTVDPLDE